MTIVTGVMRLQTQCSVILKCQGNMCLNLALIDDITGDTQHMAPLTTEHTFINDMSRMILNAFNRLT